MRALGRFFPGSLYSAPYVAVDSQAQALHWATAKAPNITKMSWMDQPHSGGRNSSTMTWVSNAPLKNGMRTTTTSGMIVIAARTRPNLAPPERPLEPKNVMSENMMNPSTRLSRVELTPARGSMNSWR